MDQKRLIVAIAVSIAILLGFQFLMPKAPPARVHQETAAVLNPPRRRNGRTAQPDPSFPGTEPEAVPRAEGCAPGADQRRPRQRNASACAAPCSMTWCCATITRRSARPRRWCACWKPQTDPEPNYIQYGWTSDTPGVKLPDDATVWTPSAKELTQASTADADLGTTAPACTSAITFAIDDYYMFTVTQSVKNTGSTPVALHPYSRVRREYQPVTAGYYILHEGPLGVLDGKLDDPSYATVKTDAEKKQRGRAIAADHRRLDWHHR